MLTAALQDMTAESDRLTTEIQALKARLEADSSTSNLPPSKDKPWKPQNERVKTPRSSGGQPSHVGKTLEMSLQSSNPLEKLRAEKTLSLEIGRLTEARKSILRGEFITVRESGEFCSVLNVDPALSVQSAGKLAGFYSTYEVSNFSTGEILVEATILIPIVSGGNVKVLTQYFLREFLKPRENEPFRWITQSISKNYYGERCTALTGSGSELLLKCLQLISDGKRLSKKEIDFLSMLNPAKKSEYAMLLKPKS